MKSQWGYIVAITFLLLFVMAFIQVLTDNPNIAGALVVFGTLALAFVTALLIINSNEQEKHRKGGD